jgi:disulfide bond formation protein DsbB
LTWVALLLAAVATAGSLYLSMGLGLDACPFCFYQRSFAMAVLALPLAAAGLGVAVFHIRAEAMGKLECPLGILDLGSAPQQSLAALGLLTVVLLLDAGSRRIGGGWLAGAAGLVLGALLAAGCIVSSPKPKVPDKPYDGPPKVCRPPYVEKK